MTKQKKLDEKLRKCLLENIWSMIEDLSAKVTAVGVEDADTGTLADLVDSLRLWNETLTRVESRAETRRGIDRTCAAIAGDKTSTVSKLVKPSKRQKPLKSR